MKTLFLSIGHDWGNGDQGATAFNTTEAQETKKIIDGIVAKGIPGVAIIKVPEGLTLRQRIDWINAHIANHVEPFALELHLDSGPSSAQGASVWYAAGNTYTPTEGAQFLQKYTEITGEPSRHVNPDSQDRLKYLGFVEETHCAALLIELGFISNGTDLSKIRQKGLQGVIAGVQNMNAL